MRYANAAAFRMALEERIRQRSATDGVAIQRPRKRVRLQAVSCSSTGSYSQSLVLVG
jgi:hypothetical protein